MSTALAFLAAAGFVLVPGLVALFPAHRLSPLARLALAAPVSLAFIGVVGVVDGIAHLPFRWWHVLLAATLIGLITWVGLPRRSFNRLRRGPSRHTLILFTAWGVSAVTTGAILLHALPSPDLYSQSYDNLFHLNATTSILQTGDASSLTLRTLTNTGRTYTALTPPAGTPQLR